MSQHCASTREHDADVNVEEGRWIAARIEGFEVGGARGSDHVLNGDDWSEIADEIEEFVTGHRTGSCSRIAFLRRSSSRTSLVPPGCAAAMGDSASGENYFIGTMRW